MSLFFLGPLLLLAYGLLCLFAPEKHLAFNAWSRTEGGSDSFDLRNLSTDQATRANICLPYSRAWPISNYSAYPT
jgi:hypothetical protein